MDLLKRTVSRGDIEVQLSTRELDLLGLFHGQRGSSTGEKKEYRKRYGVITEKAMTTSCRFTPITCETNWKVAVFHASFILSEE